MHKSAVEKKRTGSWGEQMVDAYMQRQGFSISVANRCFRGGEIDRIYTARSNFNQKVFICMAEVKTSSITSVSDIETYSTHETISRFIRKRQLRNLHFFGETFAAGYHKNGVTTALYARVFLVARIHAKNGKLPMELKNFPGKICDRQAGYWILSIDPYLSEQNFS